jgi:hypothetical protein
MATYAYTFNSGDTVTPPRLNAARTVSDIVNADIKSDAAIAGTKVAPAFGAQDITVSGADRSITNTGNFALSFGTNNAERVRITNSGDVAIGTTSAEPGFKLHVAGNAFVAGTSGTTTKTVVDTADQRLVLGSYFESGVGQHAFIASTNNAETGNTALLFQTGTTERMRIDGSGNVGIGTTSLNSRLTIQGTGSSLEIYQAVGSIRFASSPNRTNNYFIGANISDSVNAGLQFGTGNDIATGTCRLFIDQTGKVGIGTISPGHPLSVDGDINTSEQYLVDGTQVVSNRATGWEAATGTATRTTFATSSVTTAQLAQRVKALIDDLTTHGLIGA